MKILHSDEAANPISKIELIKKELHEQLEISTRRIKLLDQIRERDGKQATQEETQHLACGFYSVPPATSEIVALMLEAKAEKRQVKNIRYEPFLIDRDDFLLKLAFNDAIEQLISNKEPFRFDYIIKAYNHCSPMQMHFDGEHLRTFFIDAAGDIKNYLYASSLQSNRAEFNYCMGDIQFDSSSCAIFSLQHLNNLSNLSSDKSSLKGDPSYLGLPAVFLKNIQSMSKLEEYYAQNGNNTIDKNGKKTLKEHIDNYTITVDVSKAGEGSMLKAQNYSIAYKNHKYLQGALGLLEKLSPAEAVNIIESRCDIYGKNALSNSTPLPKKNNIINDALTNNNEERLKELVSYAIAQKNNELLLILIKGNVDLSQPIYNTSILKGNTWVKTTPIGIAISMGDVALSRALCDAAQDKTYDSLGVPYFHNLVTKYDIAPNAIEIINLLIDNGADINAKDLLGNTIVDLCIKSYSKDSLDVLNHLFEKGAVIDLKEHNKKGELLLHAAENNDVKVFLIQKGANVNARNNKGLTLAQSCILSSSDDSLDFFKRLITLGAVIDVNGCDYSGDPLWSKTAHPAVIEFLVQQGANIQARNQQGLTIAHTYIISLSKLKELPDNSLNFLKQLISSGAAIDVNARDDQGNTLLHKVHNHELMNFLIQQGANVNARNYQQLSILDQIQNNPWDYSAESEQSIISQQNKFKNIEQFSQIKNQHQILKEECTKNSDMINSIPSKKSF